MIIIIASCNQPMQYVFTNNNNNYYYNIAYTETEHKQHKSYFITIPSIYNGCTDPLMICWFWLCYYCCVPCWYWLEFFFCLFVVVVGVCVRFVSFLDPCSWNSFTILAVSVINVFWFEQIKTEVIILLIEGNLFLCSRWI